MKTLDLNSYGVQEMNAVEMKETDGGCWGLIFAAVWIIIGILATAHPENVEATYSE